MVGTWNSPTAYSAEKMGDWLADYNDIGGAVVEMYGSFDPTDGIMGRWEREDYNTILRGPSASGWESIGIFYDPAHPLYDRVWALSAYYKHDSDFVTPGSVLLADYTSGKTLIAYRENPYSLGGRIVGLNYYPDSRYCTGDYMRLIANAVIYSSRMPYYP
jgi:hypothetical protein